jgi:allantoinase
MLPTDRISYSAITERPPLKLPDGARMAVWVIVNVEEWDPREAMPRTVLTPPAGGSPMPDIPNWAWHEYGNRVGFWRFVEVFDALSIPAVLAINGSALAAYPAIVRAALEREWEFMGHGFTQRNMQKVEGERADIRKTREVIARATGKPPRGWLGPGLTETWETPDLLVEEGYDYVADWVLDDQPVWLKTRSKPILNLPYTQECNDVAMMLIQHHKASEYSDRALDQFEQIYADSEKSARVMALVVHPYIMGAPHRLKYFRRVLETISKKSDVTFWTGAQIADWYLAGDVQAKLMLVALCLLWGVTWPAMKIALVEIPPLSMRTLTAAAGAVTLLAVCLATRTRLRVPANAWGHVVAIAFLNIGAFSLLTAYAQVAAATSRVTILIYTMPIWAVLLAWLVLREKPNARQLLSVVLCALGLVVLIAPVAATGVPLGLLLAVIAGASWGAGTVYVKWARLDIDSLALAFWQLVVAFILIAACLLLFDGRLDIDRAHAPALLATAFSGIVGSGVAYAMWFAIVRRLPAATASLGALGIPVVGVLSTVLIVGERPTATDIVGFALIFAASACVLLVPSAAARQPKSITR